MKPDQLPNPLISIVLLSDLLVVIDEGALRVG